MLSRTLNYLILWEHIFQKKIINSVPIAEMSLENQSIQTSTQISIQTTLIEGLTYNNHHKTLENQVLGLTVSLRLSSEVKITGDDQTKIIYQNQDNLSTQTLLPPYLERGLCRIFPIPMVTCII